MSLLLAGSAQAEPAGTGTVAGTIRIAGGGGPLANAYVDVFDAAGKGTISAPTDASGRWSLSLPAGSYRVLAYGGFVGYINQWYPGMACEMDGCMAKKPAPTVPVVEGEATDGIDFELSPGGWLRGRVADASDGTPLSSVDVYLYDGTGHEVYQVVTDATGSFAVGGLITGAHFVSTDNASGYVDEAYDGFACAGRIWADARCHPASGTAVPVVAGQVTEGVAIDLVRGGRIGGRLTDAATAGAVPVSGVYVHTADGWFVGDTAAGPDGGYLTSSGLPTGSYRVSTVNGSGFLDQLHSGLPCPGRTCDPVAGTAVDVVRGVTTPSIDFALSRGGRISGTITDAATGSPVRTSVVALDATGTIFDFTYADASGQYLTGSGLPAGSYWLKTRRTLEHVDELYDDVPCPGDPNAPAPLGCSLASGSAVPVAAGTTTPNVNFALSAGGRISGTVTRADGGDAIPGASVDLFTESGAAAGGGVTAGGSSFVTFGLPPGSYRLRTRNPAGYTDELYDDLPCPDGSCTVTDGTAVAVAAGAVTPGVHFSLEPGAAQSLTVERQGGGQGRVTSSPLGIDCGSACAGTFGAGTRVTLWAAAPPGSVFDGWSGACAGTWPKCRLTVDAERTVVARFVATTASHKLTTSTAGTGSGRVTSSPAGIDCPGTCSGTFGDAVAVTLTAAPSAGSGFSGWSGVCSGGTTCVVRMETDSQAGASFWAGHLLTVARDGTGSGSVSSSPPGIDCGTDCSDLYPAGSSVTLTATASAGSRFDGWSGACSGAASTCPLVLSEARSTTATFHRTGGFYTATPCRVVDTRLSGTGGPSPLAAGTETSFTVVGGACGIPATATAVALNVTATEATDNGHLRLYPAGAPRPNVSTVNYVSNRTRANNAVAPLGAGGAITVFVGQAAGSVHAVIDVSGYFR